MNLSSLKCDFCSKAEVVKAYACESFTPNDLPISQSVGGWAACKVCSELIDANEWEKLAQRATDTFLAKYNVIWKPDSQFRKEILEYMRRLHQEFNRKRMGVN